jgi:hypothetical protein
MTSNPDIRSWPGWSHICLLSKQYIMSIVYTYTLFLGSEIVYSAVWTWRIFCRATCPSFELEWSASVIKSCCLCPPSHGENRDLCVGILCMICNKYTVCCSVVGYGGAVRIGKQLVPYIECDKHYFLRPK